MYKIFSIIAFAFFIFILWIIYLANTGGDTIFFDLVKATPYGDKVGHVGLFGLLTLITIIGSKFRGFQYGKITIYYGVMAVVSFVIIEEISQAFIPSRTFDFIDLAADSIGIICAIILANVISKNDLMKKMVNI